MDHDRLPPVLLPPTLSDEAAAQILDFLYETLARFENTYGTQIDRYHFPEPEQYQEHDPRQYELFPESILPPF